MRPAYLLPLWHVFRRSLQKWGRWFAILLLISTASLVFSVARGHGILGSAIEIGEDEHFEVSKAVLWSQGFPLYTKVWNDQPPLYTVILGGLFRCFGPSIGIARGLALAFGLLLLSGCFVFAKKRMGWLAACVSTACLFVAPGVVKYGASAMLEVPAMATAMWSWWMLDRGIRARSSFWISLSGLLFATALQIKLTAIIFGPALICELLINGGAETGRSEFLQNTRAVALWCFCTIITFFIIFCVWGGSFTDTWVSHFSAETAKNAAGFTFPIDLLLENRELLAGALVGWIMLQLRKHWRRLAFPLITVATVALVHAVHRPWWNYYYIHVAIPLAWLSGYGVAELLQVHSCSDGPRTPCFWLKIGSTLIFIALIGQIFAVGEARIANEFSRIGALPKVKDSLIIRKMRHFKGETHWVYAQRPIYAFHAGLLEIPELAVLAQKRYWSGKISTQKEWGYVEEYHPEQLLLTDDVPNDMQGFVSRNYTLVYEESSLKLYVANAIAMQNAQNKEDKSF